MADRADGPRVLIVEDEFLVSIQLEEDLRAAGCSIVGPFNTLESAIRGSRTEAFDLAILDVNLNGVMVYPLADELRARGVPFVIMSGYLSNDLPERFRAAMRFTKPYDPTVVIQAIRAAVPGTPPQV